jgi:hypothetical protein
MQTNVDLEANNNNNNNNNNNKSKPIKRNFHSYLVYRLFKLNKSTFSPSPTHKSLFAQQRISPDFKPKFSTCRICEETLGKTAISTATSVVRLTAR